MLSFQKLYDFYAKDVYRFAVWLSGSPQEAEDITSETFISAWARHKSIRTKTLKAYLLTIARNIHLAQRRKDKKHIPLQDIYPDPAPEPGHRIESHLKLLEIQAVLQMIPEIDRTAFILRVQSELPYEEIARALELSLAAAKVKVHRVRQKLLAACLDKEVI
jgi:RNA polymerase sigma-70 factor (ECF subfamily)